MARYTHYPAYDVMNEKDAWDKHTQDIVTRRLVREKAFRFFKPTEIEMMRFVCSLLVDDIRGDIIQYAIGYIDEKLLQNDGEGQRKIDVMPEAELIRNGLLRLNEASKFLYKQDFIKLEKVKQLTLLEDLSQARANPAHIWDGYPQKEGFLKYLTLTLDAYFSHPKVWSDIGYGGPAYPRGYVRTNTGQLDPWEAQSEQ